MSLQRFGQILRFCRFDNFQTRAARLRDDKLAPIRDLWEMFQAQLRQLYTPCATVTIDEQLVTTRGRCNFRQYIPSKPGKYGIKIFWLRDSTNSFPLAGEIYLGKQPGAVRAPANFAADLVMRLSQTWHNQGRNITGDNFFTSIELTERLLAVRTTYVKALRNYKADIPRELLPNKQKPVESSLFCYEVNIHSSATCQKRIRRSYFYPPCIMTK